MKKVRLVMNAKSIVGDKLNTNNHDDEYIIVEDMKTYKLLLNERTNETYFVENQYIIDF